MSNFVYQLLITPMSLIAIVVALCTKRGRIGLWERCGIWRIPAGDYIWMHGASVGEINGLLPLVPLLRSKFPGSKILITATTASGRERAREFVDYVAILPWDNLISLSYALRGIRIRGFIFGETELWPGLLNLLHRRGVPVYWVNARLSDYTVRGYSILRWLLRPAVKKMVGILCGDASTSNRVLRLGALVDRVKIIGNAKFDRAPAKRDRESDLQLRKRLFSNDAPVITLSCLRPGEEEMWFKTISVQHGVGRKLNVVVAPRHAERFDYFADRLANHDIHFRRWSELENNNSTLDHQVILLDKMGVLESVYAISDCAFIGGSMVDEGGHNPLEAAAYGVFIAMGPYQSNVRELVERFTEQEAIFQISNEDSIEELVSLVIARNPKIIQSGERARRVSEEFAGIARRIVDEIDILAVGTTGNSFLRSCLMAALQPLAFLFGIIGSIRNFLYNHRILHQQRTELPIVSIGNLTVGGNSKTPMCQWLVQELISAGTRPVVLSRGYGGSIIGPHQVLVTDSPESVGDEPLLMARTTEAAVVIARDRVAGARLIEEKRLGDIIILDDGMQHRRLVRDCEILMIAAGDTDSFGEFNSGALMPVGRFREAFEVGIRRANIAVLAARQEQSDVTKANVKLLRKILPASIPVFESSLRLNHVVAIDSTGTLAPCPCIALCAIAKPEGFFTTLKQAGYELRDSIALLDHSGISTDLLERVRKKFPGTPIICTEKDAVKIADNDRRDLFVANVSLEIADSELLLNEIKKQVSVTISS